MKYLSKILCYGKNKLIYKELIGEDFPRITSPIKKPTLSEIHRERPFSPVSPGDAVLMRNEAFKIQSALREGSLSFDDLSIEQRDILELAEMLSQHETSYCFSNVITQCTDRFSLKTNTSPGNPRFLAGLASEKNEDPFCGYEAHIEERKMPVPNEDGNVVMESKKVLRISLGNQIMLATAKTFLHNPERRVMGLLSHACDFIEVQSGHETLTEMISSQDRTSHIRPRSGLNVNFSQLVQKLGRHDFEGSHLEAHIHEDHLPHLGSDRMQRILVERNLIARKVHDATIINNAPQEHHVFHIHHREKIPTDQALYAPQLQAA